MVLSRSRWQLTEFERRFDAPQNFAPAVTARIVPVEKRGPDAAGVEIAEGWGQLACEES
jgi:hypothetical protein